MSRNHRKIYNIGENIRKCRDILTSRTNLTVKFGFEISHARGNTNANTNPVIFSISASFLNHLVLIFCMKNEVEILRNTFRKWREFFYSKF